MSFDGDSSLISGQLRIAALSLALVDVLQTAPREIRLYQSDSGSFKKLLFPAARYFGIAAIILNSVFYFGSWQPDSCRRAHLVPGIFQFLAMVLTQAIYFYHTFTISKHSRNTFGILTFLIITLTPLQAIAVTFRREPSTFVNELTKHSSCLSLVPSGKFNAGPVLYLSHLGYDLFVMVLSTYHLYQSKSWSTYKEFAVLIHQHGMTFILADFVVYLLSLLGSVGVRGLASMGSLPAIVVALIAAQHVLLKSSIRKPLIEAERLCVYPSAPNPSNYVAAQSTASLVHHAKIGTIASTLSLPGTSDPLPCLTGRDALRFRDEGDTAMYHERDATTTTVVTKEGESWKVHF